MNISKNKQRLKIDVNKKIQRFCDLKAFLKRRTAFLLLLAFVFLRKDLP